MVWLIAFVFAYLVVGLLVAILELILDRLKNRGDPQLSTGIFIMLAIVWIWLALDRRFYDSGGHRFPG